MKIDAQIGLVQGDKSGSVEPRDQTAWQLAWRRELELAHDLHSAGQYLAAAPLHPTSRAISVRVRESKRLVTDGPFAETREQLGGYFLVEARDSDEAIDIATRKPAQEWSAGLSV